MNRAWQNMRGTIVNAASQIQVQSYQKFNSLHTSIASFYNQLASAHFTAGLAAGPGGFRGRIGLYGKNTGGPIHSSYGSNGSQTISTIQKEYTGGFESYGPSSMSDRKRSKLYLELLDDPDEEMLKALDSSQGCVGDDCYYGTVENNFQRIKQTGDSWSIADPYFLGIQLPMNNHVRDWDDGRTKQIDSANFESYLRLILTTRGFNNPGTYQHYANSMKSNQQVWDEVACNCYDGAEMIAEIGRMLVGNGTITHGSWKGEGHMAAVVNGQIFDMTQFQKHGVFRGTPGVSFGPSSSNVSHEQYGSNGGSSSTHPQNSTVVNVSFDGATIVGEEGLKDKIKDLIVRTIYEERGANPNTGL
jgi:hypothetical protein